MTSKENAGFDFRNSADSTRWPQLSSLLYICIYRCQ